VATGWNGGSWLSLPEVGVVDLKNASLPDPTDSAFVVGGTSELGVTGDLADPRPDAFDKLGLSGRLFGSLWFDRIHVLPRERDLGSVVSEQEVTVEVSGIEVDNPAGLPTHFPASESKLYTVRVLAEGDPQIDNIVTWEFDGLDTSGTTFAVVGFRLIPFPFPPNMLTPIKESFGYLTSIIEAAYDGSEQRVQLREVPVGTVGYTVLLYESHEAQMAGAILFGNQPRAFGVGRWQFQTPLAADAAAEDLNVYCTTTDIPFVAGGLVMLWASPFAWEVQTIDSVEVDHLVLMSPLRSAWAEMTTAVLPMLVGRLTEQESLAWESLLVLSQNVIFNIDGFKPRHISALTFSSSTTTGSDRS
jgi:hypothetical protein